MLNDTKDKDEIEMLKEESQGLASRVPELEESLKLLLIPKDPNDDKNVIVEIIIMCFRIFRIHSK